MGVSHLSATELVAKAQSIHDAMTANPVYATPNPSLTVLQTGIDKLAEANAAVDENPGPAEHHTRRQYLLQLKALLKTLAGYVQTTSGVDETKILSSGFDVARRGSPIGELNPPVNLGSRVTSMSGRVSLKWESPYGTEMNHVFMSEASSPFNWVLIGATSKSRFNADSLEPGKFYWFAVSAIGAAGETSKSEPARAMAAA